MAKRKSAIGSCLLQLIIISVNLLVPFNFPFLFLILLLSDPKLLPHCLLCLLITWQLLLDGRHLDSSTSERFEQYSKTSVTLKSCSPVSCGAAEPRGQQQQLLPSLLSWASPSSPPSSGPAEFTKNSFACCCLLTPDLCFPCFLCAIFPPTPRGEGFILLVLME